MSLTVFFDTEFTSIEPHTSPTLISIGLIAMDGREFYAELLDTWSPDQCSYFVLETVLPLLEGGAVRMTEAQLAIQLKEWIEGLGEQEVVLRSDAPPYDWPWVFNLFQSHRCWPKNLRRVCGNIFFRQYRYQTRYRDALEEYWEQYGELRHHALIDARSLHFSWIATRHPRKK